MSMKKYLLNKNVVHNGKMFASGSEIKESDDGFKDIVKAGHAHEFSFDDESKEQPVEQEKPVGKPKK